MFFECSTSYALKMYKNHYTIYSFVSFIIIIWHLFQRIQRCKLHLPAEQLWKFSNLNLQAALHPQHSHTHSQSQVLRYGSMHKWMINRRALKWVSQSSLSVWKKSFAWRWKTNLKSHRNFSKPTQWRLLNFTWWKRGSWRISNTFPAEAQPMMLAVWFRQPARRTRGD